MTLLILDGPLPSGVQPGGAAVIQWSGGDQADESPSVPLMVEQHAAQLRAEFLAWTYELAERRLESGQTLREALQIDGARSLWWSTLLAEKSPLKCPAIYTVLKLRMLERFVTANAFTGLWLHSPDRQLAETLSRWCRSSQRTFKWSRPTTARTRRTLRDRFEALPHPVQAALALGRRCWRRARAGAAAANAARGGGDALTVVSYFPNVDMRAFKEGRFQSNYWGTLQDIIDSPQRLANWILLFEPNEALSYADAVRFCRRVNAEHRQRRFFLVESFLSASGVVRAVRTCIQLAWRTVRMTSLRPAFVMPGSTLNFWPVLARDWRSSTYGFSAMEACLWREAFRSARATLGPQARGLYLHENQIWERNLITTWGESRANGPLIGYQHSFPKFMDLRLFEDPRAYRLTDSPPLPDVLAVCGPAAFDVMEQSGFPTERLRTVEAARYDYLRELAPMERSSTGTGERTLLVLGSISYQESRDVLALLAAAAAAGGLSPFARIMAKSHPNTPLRPIIQDVCAGVPIVETQEPLSRLWAEADVIVCANSTTACLEALWIGKPVVALGGRRSLNLNPLFRIGRIPFVNSVEELTSALQRPAAVVNGTSPALFHFSPGLTEWRKLLH